MSQSPYLLVEISFGRRPVSSKFDKTPIKKQEQKLAIVSYGEVSMHLFEESTKHKSTSKFSRLGPNFFTLLNY